MADAVNRNAEDVSHVRRRERPVYRYAYTCLDKLPSSGKFNTYAVVKFVKDIKETARGDFHKLIGLHNENLYKQGKKLLVSIFSNRPEDLPICSPDDIIRLHRLQIQSYNEEINGRLLMNGGGSWLIFDSFSDSYDWVSSSSGSPTFSEAEKEILQQLRDWVKKEAPSDKITKCQDPCAPEEVSRRNIDGEQSARKRETARSESIFLRSICKNSYFNLTVQLLQRSTLKQSEKRDNLVVLKVWDGTITSLKLNEPVWTDFDREFHSETLLHQLPHYCVNLILYGEHVTRAKQLRLGAFYRFSGVHCIQYPKVGIPELYLHESNRVLATTVPKEERDAVIERMEEALQGVDNVFLDIVPDDRTEEDFLTERQQDLIKSHQVVPPADIRPILKETSQEESSAARGSKSNQPVLASQAQTSANDSNQPVVTILAPCPAGISDRPVIRVCEDDLLTRVRTVSPQNKLPDVQHLGACGRLSKVESSSASLPAASSSHLKILGHNCDPYAFQKLNGIPKEHHLLPFPYWPVSQLSTANRNSRKTSAIVEQLLDDSLSESESEYQSVGNHTVTPSGFLVMTGRDELINRFGSKHNIPFVSLQKLSYPQHSPGALTANDQTGKRPKTFQMNTRHSAKAQSESNLPSTSAQASVDDCRRNTKLLAGGIKRKKGETSQHSLDNSLNYEDFSHKLQQKFDYISRDILSWKNKIAGVNTRTKRLKTDSEDPEIVKRFASIFQKALTAHELSILLS